MNVRSSLAWLASLFGLGAGYPSTNPKNAEFRGDWQPSASPGDAAIADTLPALAADCRDLDRQSAKARAIVDGLRADWVGGGIGIEPTLTGNLARLVPTLRDGFNAWAEHAGVNGESLWQMQWVAAGDIATAGAFLWRWVQVEDPTGIPLRLLPLEVEWLSPTPLRDVPPGRFAAGCETDDLGRVVAWHLVDPSSAATSIVPAADVIHGYVQRRARQRVGEPTLSPLVLRLWQDDKLVVTELRAAINTSNVAGVLETEDADLAMGGPAGATVAPSPGAPPNAALTAARRLAPGTVLALRPGEKWQTVENKRPSQNLPPFRASLDGDLAGGAGVSRQWIDRDTSRANYSSMREDNLRTSRAVAPIQAMIGRAMASRVYERLVPYLLIQAGEKWPGGARERAALLRHDLRPDRIPYVDPAKEAAADVYQVEHNLTTLEEVLASKGRDLSTVLAKRAAEQEALDKQAVARVQRLAKLAAASGVEGLSWSHLVTLAGASSAPGAYLAAAAPDTTPAQATADPSRAFEGLRLVRDASGEVCAIEPVQTP